MERYLSGLDTWLINPGALSLILIGAGILILIGQLTYLNYTDVLAMAQKPSFARDGLSVFYLLFSHIFEHFLDLFYCSIDGWRLCPCTLAGVCRPARGGLAGLVDEPANSGGSFSTGLHTL